MMTRETFRRRIFETPLIEQAFLDHIVVRNSPKSVHGLDMLVDADLCLLRLDAADYFGWHLESSVVPVGYTPRILTGLRLAVTPNIRDCCAVEVQWGHHRRVLRENIRRGEPAEGDEGLNLNRCFAMQPTLFHNVPLSIYLRAADASATLEIEKRRAELFDLHVTIIGYELPHNLVDAAQDWLK